MYINSAHDDLAHLLRRRSGHILHVQPYPKCNMIKNNLKYKPDLVPPYIDRPLLFVLPVLRYPSERASRYQLTAHFFAHSVTLWAFGPLFEGQPWSQMSVQ